MSEVPGNVSCVSLALNGNTEQTRNHQIKSNYGLIVCRTWVALACYTFKVVCSRWVCLGGFLFGLVCAGELERVSACLLRLQPAVLLFE